MEENFKDDDGEHIFIKSNLKKRKIGIKFPSGHVHDNEKELTTLLNQTGAVEVHIVDKEAH